MLSDYLEYKQDGTLVWKKSTNNRSVIGTVAGTNRNGYIIVTVKKKPYKAHRIVWLLNHGVWPKGEIDHINGVASDNRIENLRDVSPLTNAKNKAINKNNTSGVLGVHYDTYGVRWTASIWNNYSREVKHFKTKDDAIKWRKDKEVEYGYHENHGRVRSKQQ